MTRPDVVASEFERHHAVSSAVAVKVRDASGRAPLGSPSCRLVKINLRAQCRRASRHKRAQAASPEPASPRSAHSARRAESSSSRVTADTPLEIEMAEPETADDVSSPCQKCRRLLCRQPVIQQDQGNAGPRAGEE